MNAGTCWEQEYNRLNGLSVEKAKKSDLTWTLLIAHSKAKLKSIGDKASPCFKPFFIGNLSDTCVPARTLVYVSVKPIFINLTSFMWIPNSMRILYKTSLINELWVFFQSVNSWCTASLSSHTFIIVCLEVCHYLMHCLIVLPFFPSRWRMQNIYTGGADKSLARLTSRCILFDGENISFDASLVLYV